jgi:predicted phosphodiesterase
VVFGHTHKPEGVWEDGVFYGNTGSWSPAYKDLECTQPLSEERPVVWLRSEGRNLSGGLVTWRGGRFVEG